MTAACTLVAEVERDQAGPVAQALADRGDECALVEVLTRPVEQLAQVLGGLRTAHGLFVTASFMGRMKRSQTAPPVLLPS